MYIRMTSQEYFDTADASRCERILSRRRRRTRFRNASILTIISCCRGVAVGASHASAINNFDNVNIANHPHNREPTNLSSSSWDFTRIFRRVKLHEKGFYNDNDLRVLAFDDYDSEAISNDNMKQKLPRFKPTIAPSKSPTMEPTIYPSNSPSYTNHPSAITSPRSDRPSDIPSRIPSEIISNGPTVYPSSTPSLLRSFAPSHTYTSYASTTPSHMPSIYVTNLPTEISSVMPSVPPTSSPSTVPSGSPTMYFSDYPSSILTVTPTSFPSSSPSSLPSISPSLDPTTAPSSHPSSLPSILHSVHPTIVPSSYPSMPPTISHSLYPTVPTSSSPTEQYFEHVKDLMLLITGAHVVPMPLDDTISDWQSLTSTHIQNFLNDFSIESKVNLSVPRQDPDSTYSAHVRGHKHLNKHELQGNVDHHHHRNHKRDNNEEDELLLTFDVWIRYFSSTKNNDIKESVRDAFRTMASQTKYGDLLQGSLSDYYGNLGDLLKIYLVEEPEENISYSKLDDNRDDDNDQKAILSTLWVMLIGSAAVCAFLLSLIYYYYRPVAQIGLEIEITDDGSEDFSSIMMSRLNSNTPSENNSASIRVQPSIEFAYEGIETIHSDVSNIYCPPLARRPNFQDDPFSAICTLGSPQVTGTLSLLSSSSQRKSLTDSRIFGTQSTLSFKSGLHPIDKFKNAFTFENSAQSSGLNHAPSGASKSCGTDEEYSYTEQLIEVDAPAGMLGIVVDSSLPGAPVVHAIKESSVLSSRLHIGDRIVYVDDVDSTDMSSMELTKLIGSKSENSVRRFGIIRKVLIENDSISTHSWEQDLLLYKREIS